MALDYQIMLIAATGGIIRNIIGFLKAKRRHGAKYKPLKLVITLVWSGIVGAVLTYLYQGHALGFASIELVLMAVAGTVILDELFQTIFSKGKSGGDFLDTAKPAK